MADPLVEHELLLVLLDLVLHKREAYRHLLFNRPPHCALGWRGVCVCVSRERGGRGRHLSIYLKTNHDGATQ